MSSKTVYTAAEVALALSKRVGTLQALEVKEIQLNPYDSDRKIYGCKYKSWNCGQKAAPVVIWKNREPQFSGYIIPSEKINPDTPYEFVVNQNGIVQFENGLVESDVVHAGFTFRLFSEEDLSVALQTVGFSTLASMAPISIDPRSIPDFMVEPLILATMVHLREALLSEQSLYYSYSIQEQSHQLKQVHDSLESDINRDRAALEKLVDSSLWFRLQGKGRRTISRLSPDSPYGVPWVVGGSRGLDR